MKKLTRNLIIIVVLLALICTGVAIRKGVKSKPMTRQDPHALDSAAPLSADTDFEDYLDWLNRTAVKGNKKLDIPVYYDYDLLMTSGYYIHIANDYGPFNRGNTLDSIGILIRYPTNAVRMRDDGSVYFVYESESGERVYIFLDDSNEYFAPRGTAVVIGDKIFSYSDFADLKVGDTIKKVSEIDPLMELYRRKLIGIEDTDDRYSFLIYRSLFEQNRFLSSIHYLTDGILKIEYTAGESDDENALVTADDIIIYNIEYSEDYILNDFWEEPVNYRILDIDLPKQSQ